MTDVPWEYEAVAMYSFRVMASTNNLRWRSHIQGWRSKGQNNLTKYKFWWRGKNLIYLIFLIKWFFFKLQFLFLITFELVLFNMAAPIEPSLMISHKITRPDGSFKKNRLWTRSLTLVFSRRWDLKCDLKA